MLRRLKRDVMAELPPKRRQVVRLPHPKPADWPDQELAEGELPSCYACKCCLQTQCSNDLAGTADVASVEQAN